MLYIRTTGKSDIPAPCIRPLVLVRFSGSATSRSFSTIGNMIDSLFRFIYQPQPGSDLPLTHLEISPRVRDPIRLLHIEEYQCGSMPYASKQPK